jgi:hypothetical protein
MSEVDKNGRSGVDAAYANGKTLTREGRVVVTRKLTDQSGTTSLWRVPERYSSVSLGTSEQGDDVVEHVLVIDKGRYKADAAVEKPHTKP